MSASTTEMDPAVALHYRYVCTAVDRIVACLDDLSAEEQNWRPLGAETSSLYILAVHTMGNVKQNVAILTGQPDTRDRDAEFAARAGSGEQAHWLLDHGHLVEHWDQPQSTPRQVWESLKDQLAGDLATITEHQLDTTYDHPRRGKMNGWEILLVAATHANEHVGHAELTRQWLTARTSG
jgi:hypothetical protein